MIDADETGEGANMQRNDLVIFEFSNPISGGEVLLNPRTVPEISEFLRSVTRAWVDVHDPSAQFEMFLTAIDRGSVKIAFLVRFMESANTAIEFAQKIAPSLLQVGLTLGVLTLSSPASSVQDDAPTPELIKNCQDAFENLIRTAGRSGADEVSVSFPGCGTALITGIKSRDVQLIGTSAIPLFENSSGIVPGYQGPLRNIVGPFELNRKNDGHTVRVFVGDIELQGGNSVKVVLHWNSKRPIEQAMAQGEVTVKGNLGPLQGFLMQGEMVSDQPIDPALRRVRAYLYVESQSISE